MSKYNLVHVEWDDSTNTPPDWHKIGSSILKPAKCVSVGYIVYECKRYITLAQSLTDGGDCSNIFTIPRGCITRTRKIKL